MNSKRTLLGMVLFLTATAFAQNVNIPDANFKAYLVGNTSINTNSDTEIQVSEAQAFSGIINCPGQNIADLTGIEEFVNVTALYCNQNVLTNLNVSQNTALTTLWCNENQISILDVSLNTALVELRCYANNLFNLDVSLNTNLTTLFCGNNNLSSLDLSQNLMFESLSCSFNELSSLNLANGNNINVTNMNLTHNPYLGCVEVDDAVYAETNWTFVDPAVNWNEDCDLCTVNIPDANFKAALVGNTSINLNGDNEIQCNEASSYVNSINVQSDGISDMTGIEAFLNLYSLKCAGNSFAALDLSNNEELVILECGSNPSLTQLNLTSNEELEQLKVGSTSLTSLDLSNNDSIYLLYANYMNNLTSLDVSNLSELKILDISEVPLVSIDLSANSKLEEFGMDYGLISEIDLSNNPALIEVYAAYSDSLSTLNVANGSNANITSFNASNNPNLTCIEVDDAAYSSTNWTNIDAGTSFSEDCSGGFSSLEELRNSSVSIYPNPFNDQLFISTDAVIERVEIYSVDGSLILATNESVINAATLEAGIYIVLVKSGENTQVEKLIKE
jgi:Leucine-rich repeat (LRR) protein